ncbi:metal ABC transporter ATP-binding protein [Butyrivibrio sp. AC2005]|jgi:zinc transport system ATP-binding protein|uniref:metal ABC transporter ATP-binding protein n=1 Tax=Butyrivibrio sp. AC2005 TaxID=1280672 RepID=UPI00041F58A5|nr:metal ABC transporter ATP-binding protein [Butyrivibrio sp. AC2005]
MALLTVKNLKLGYESDVILDGLSFTVDKGDYLCIVGENGSGKSTLMKTLLGLMKPLGGEILTSDGLSRNEIGYLPQQTLVQRDFPASVWEIVLSGCQNSRRLNFFYSKKDKALARKNIERMGLNSYMYKCYRDLSGGQQQRVLLARALCAAKEVLLLDEPVAGLDPIVTAEMYDLIDSLNNDGITIIMISHDIAAATRYASHILHISSDLFYGTKDEYLRANTSNSFIGIHDSDLLKGKIVNG